MAGPLFGIIPAGQPLITEPSSTPSPTSLLYSIPGTSTSSPTAAKPFSHIVVFLLPNIVLPENTAAAIYISTAQDVASAAQSNATPNFRFLGAIGPGKESAIFKVGGSDAGLVIGVSLEPAEAVGQRLLELASSSAGVGGAAPGPGGAAGSAPGVSTAVLAQRIIQNAFNFLASFSGSATGPGGVEVVPLKAFEDWWRKFESRVRSDPSFLERQSE